MINKSVLYTNLNELQYFIIQNKIDSFKKVFVQVFLAYNDEPKVYDILDIIKKNLKDVSIIGGSVNSSIYEGEIYENKTVITFTVSSTITARTVLYSTNDYEEKDVANIIAQNFITPDTKLLLAYGDKNTINGDLFIRSFNEHNLNIPVSGGIFGDFERLGYIFNEKKVIKGGIVCLALDSPYLEVNMIVNSGWQGIGKEHTITKVIDNIIYEIDGINAVDFYQNKVGEFAKNNPDIRIQFPVLVSNGDYFNPKVINSFKSDGGLNITGIISEGDKILFSYGNKGYLLEEAYKNYNSFNNINAEAIYVICCATRKYLLKDKFNYEIAPVREAISLPGFCGLGEIFTLNNSSYFANQVNVLLVLSEKKNCKIKIDSNLPDEITKEIYESLTLHSLIKNCNTELNEYNLILEKQIKNKTDRIEELFTYDNITTLKNRNSLVYDLKLKKLKEKKLAIIDVVRFSELNDFYGSEQGDIIIKNIGDRLEGYEKKYKLRCYRLYSDKFVILGDHNISISKFKTYMKKIHDDFNNITFKIFDLDSVPIHFRVSVCYSQKKDLLEKADLGLSYAKRNDISFIIYDENLEIESQILDNILWSRKLKKAFLEDRVIPFYQPIINNITRKTEKFECLARLIDEDGTVVAPYKFISVSKRMGLYSELTKTIINKSFETFKNSDFKFSINLSIDDILDSNTRKFILNKLKNYESNSRVIFEIVESEEIILFKEVKNFIKEIKKYGAQIAIDDFGSGYSNFICLHELNIDQLKIDGSIVKALKTDDSKVKNIVKTIVEFASNLGIETTAEFIEDEELYNKVTSLGVNYSQGYYFSAPIETPFSYE